MSNDEVEPNVAVGKAYWLVGAILQLLLVGLCLELLLGLSNGISWMLRLFLLAVIIASVVLRLGWLSLIAIQISLFVQEPVGSSPQGMPSGFTFTLVAIFATVAAMRMPQTHRLVTSYFLRLAGIRVVEQGKSEANVSWRSAFFLVHLVHLCSAVVFAIFLLMNLRFGRQDNNWLQWSLKNGQAIWPGTILLVLMIALLVLVREVAWRQIVASQASLYLRSVQMTSNFRDLIAFERQRHKRTRQQEDRLRKPPPDLASRSKMTNNTKAKSANSKGLK